MINFTFVTKKNDIKIILVTVNNIDIIKGNYKGETGTIVKVDRKKIALNLEKKICLKFRVIFFL